MLLQRLFPEPAEVEAEDLHTGLKFGRPPPVGRPYLVLNMVASLDGKAVLDGGTRDLGGEADKRIFHLLRTQVDAVMAGAGTVRVERYGRPVRSDELRERRIAEGKDPDPLMVVVSERLILPSDLPLLQDPQARVVIVTGADHELEGVEAEVGYLRTGSDVGEMLRALRNRYHVGSVLCEGGPTLNSHLFAAGAVDELFLCTSPQIVGGPEALTIVAGDVLSEPRSAELVWLLKAQAELFARWRIARP